MEDMDDAGHHRVVVGLSGSLGSLTALHRAAAEARRTGAVLVAVLAWEPPGGEFAYRRSPCPPLLDAGRTGPGSGCSTPSSPPSAASRKTSPCARWSSAGPRDGR